MRNLIYTLKVIGVVLAGIAALFLLTVVWFLFFGGRGDNPARSSVARTRSDLRTLATSIESYYIDHNCYPAWSSHSRENAFHDLDAKDAPVYAKQPTFMIQAGEKPIDTLTTPVAYITQYFSDIWSPQKKQVFSYWSVDKGWILWSPGPDGKYDLTIDNVAEAYQPNLTTPNAYLRERTYDPTNGATSAGDVFRVKE